MMAYLPLRACTTPPSRNGTCDAGSVSQSLYKGRVLDVSTGDKRTSGFLAPIRTWFKQFFGCNGGGGNAPVPVAYQPALKISAPILTSLGTLARAHVIEGMLLKEIPLAAIESDWIVLQAALDEGNFSSTPEALFAHYSANYREHFLKTFETYSAGEKTADLTRDSDIADAIAQQISISMMPAPLRAPLLKISEKWLRFTSTQSVGNTAPVNALRISPLKTETERYAHFQHFALAALAEIPNLFETEKSFIKARYVDAFHTEYIKHWYAATDDTASVWRKFWSAHEVVFSRLAADFPQMLLQSAALDICKRIEVLGGINRSRSGSWETEYQGIGLQDDTSLQFSAIAINDLRRDVFGNNDNDAAKNTQAGKKIAVDSSDSVDQIDLLGHAYAENYQERGKAILRVVMKQNPESFRHLNMLPAELSDMQTAFVEAYGRHSSDYFYQCAAESFASSITLPAALLDVHQLTMHVLTEDDVASSSDVRNFAAAMQKLSAQIEAMLAASDRKYLQNALAARGQMLTQNM
jgi:hypothetical protein